MTIKVANKISFVIYLPDKTTGSQNQKKKIEKLLPPAVNSSIKTGGYNIITIRKLKNTIFVFINETLVGQFNDLKPEGNLIGFNVGLDSEISVDNLKITYLKDKNIPLFAEKVNTQQNTNQPSVNTSYRNSSAIGGPLIVWVQISAEENCQCSIPDLV